MTLLGQDDILEQQGLRKVSPLTDPDAHAQRPGRARRAGAGRQGRGARAGVGVRVRRRGAGLGLADDQVGRAGRRRRRRRGGLHHAHPDRRVLPDAGDEHAQRRTRGRVPPVRRRSRRVRARRGRRRSWCSSARTSPAPAGRPVYGRLAGIGTSADASPHHRTGSDRQRRGAGDRGGAAHGGPGPSGRRARQLPRDVHPGGRRRRGGGDPRRDRRPPGAHRTEVGDWATCWARPERWRASRRCCRYARGSSLRR